MLQKFIAWVDRQPISLFDWLVAFCGVVFIRCMLEAFSNPPVSGIIASDAPTLIHYFSSYLAIILGMACILRHFTGHAERILKLLIFGLPVIWLAPVADIVISHGAGFRITYFFEGLPSLAIHALLFLTPWSVLTPGLCIELTVICCASGLYAWIMYKEFSRAIKTALAFYGFLFFIFSLPSLLYLCASLPSAINDVSTVGAIDFLRSGLEKSSIASNDLHTTELFNSPERAFEVGFDYLMIQVNFFLILLFGFWWFRHTYAQKFSAILRNCRPERILFYLLFLWGGMLEACSLHFVPSFNWVDGISVMVLSLAWSLGWIHAVHINDIADQPIDRISNAARPLIAGSLSAEEMSQSGWLLAGLSLLGTYAVGYYPFFFNIVFLACYYIYSAPPLRLKRIPILSSALIAIAILSTAMAGFFFLSMNKNFSAFPLSLAFGTILVFTLGVNMRDIKDIEGDRAAGVYTLPVLFGRYGRHAVGVLFALAFLCAPAILRMNILYLVAIPAALLGYVIAIRQHYREKYVFILYFLAVAMSLVLLKFSG